MPKPGFTNLTLKSELVKMIDDFLASNSEGYRDRAEVMAAALREFVLRRSDKAIAAAELRSMIDRYLAQDQGKRGKR